MPTRVWIVSFRIFGIFFLLSISLGAAALAELPTGYLVWVHGDVYDRASRKVHRLTLPQMTDEIVLTSGEDTECQISPDGKWVAYAKAKVPQTDYHQFGRWKIYVVSIHGMGDGREEIKIDDNGYWPSWSEDNALNYSQVDDEDSHHTTIMRVYIDDYGTILSQQKVYSTQTDFAAIREVNECFVSPDGSWFAARTRGSSSINGVSAFTIDPAGQMLIARAGSVGCMPYVAPSGDWALIAGRDQGIRWGHAPHIVARKEDQLLIPPREDGDLCYHPGVSSDGKWVMAAHSKDDDHNAGDYQIYLYSLSADMQVDHGQPLTSEGFNGWPHIWVGQPSDPPAPRPHIDSFYPEAYTIIKGEPVLLKWTTSFSDQVQLDGQDVEPDGQQSVTPEQDAVYQLIARSSYAQGEDQAQTSIRVLDQPEAVQIVDFTASQSAIKPGESSLLSWRVENATTLALQQRQVAPAGSLEVSPDKTTVYSLQAAGHLGPVEKQLTVTVEGFDDTLPDRGGCMCTSFSSQGGILILLCAVFWCRLRRFWVS